MATTKQQKITAIRLAFDLIDLPTAQHKAGLAGLLLQIRSMQERTQEFTETDIPEIIESSATSATISFTQRSLQAIFDDLYSARVVEVPVASKWPKQKPKRIEEHEQQDPASGKTKKVKRYIYDVVQPHSPFLRQHFPDGDGLWLKLWREMIWAIPRGKPTTRGPFNDRGGERPTTEAAKVWQELLAFEKAAQKNQIRTCKVSSALLLGAQASNAEAVKFNERSDFLLLLHFWQLTVLVFVPQAIDRDGKGEFVGYSLAIPEVANLERFCLDYPRLIARLATTARGFRPAAAVIDIPEQAGLEFIRHLAQLTAQDVQHSRVHRSVHSIDYMHCVKAGNNVKTASAGCVIPNDTLLKDYLAIMRSGATSRGFRNPLFRSGLLRSLLRNRPWHDGMRDMLVQRRWQMFLRCAETPKSVPWFFHDAAAKFDDIESAFKLDLEDYSNMNPTEQAAGKKPATPLSLLVHRLVRTYVQRKTEERCGISWNDFKQKKIKDDAGKERIDVPKEYREAKEKVASTAYLAMRSRRDRDFATFFTASICSTGQFLSEEEYQTVADALLANTEEIKTLCLLALSANS